ncbi:MAG TPA: ROK family protein [Chthoniobacterales bacterium]
MYSLGIDFGGTSVKPGVTRGGAIVEYGNLIDTRKFHTSAEITQAMLAEIARLREKYPNIAAVGIGLPGLVDNVRGFVRELTNVRDWKNVPLREIVTGATGLPTAIENDAKAMAYAEFKFGAARGFNHVVCVTLGTGVGGALILNGQLHRGAANSAGEIGQTHCTLDHPPAHYGNTGALEKLVGNQEITQRAIAAYSGGPFPGAEPVSPAALAVWANAGDRIAQQLWDQIGTEIGIVFSDIVWLLNPDAFVIGGGVAKAGDLVFNPIRKAINSRTMKDLHESLKIIPAALGNDAGIIGSAALGLEVAGK